jgi:predicted RNase H-like HicB family nuclease
VNASAKYIKMVEWSDEDDCFIGQCPGVVGPCCHGDNEAGVYAELCEIVDECLEILKRDGRPLPPSTAGKGFAEKVAS